MARGKNGKDARPIIIRREEVSGGGHHGGAWKVAYADFVTAMMAFFLLMWLLNATTEEQRKGLADYFSPMASTTRNTSGSGSPWGGKTVNSDGSLASDKGAMRIQNGNYPVTLEEEDEDADTPSMRPGPLPTKTPPQVPVSGQQAAGAAQRQAFESAAEQIKAAVKADAGLGELGHQLAIDITPEGLRIQIMDEDRLPMFANGSTQPNERARLLLQKVAPVLARLPESISIYGHTDAAPYKSTDRGNWELSAERANATRRLLVDGGLAENRLRGVTGLADREPLLPADPFAAANRRIAIIVHRQAPEPKPRGEKAAVPSAAPASVAPVQSPQPAPLRAPAPAKPADAKTPDAKH